MSTKQAQVSLMDLFKVGSHRGNSKSKLNPKIKDRIYGAKQGLSLIDLTAIQESLESIEQLLENLGRRKKQLLVVGTSKHTSALAKTLAERLGAKGMPFVNKRWLGGTLTNWPTIKKTLKRLEKNEKIVENEKFFDTLSRNEKLSISRETKKLQEIFGGLRYLKSNRPGAVIVLDAGTNSVAILESDLNNIPVITLTNTGSQTLSKNLEYTMVCNNNSSKLLEILADRFILAYNNGLASTVEIKKDEKTNKEESKK